MPHYLPPEHEDSPASTFAQAQPAAGVVADDVPDEQNPAGKPKAKDATAKKVKADAYVADPAPGAPSQQVAPVTKKS